MTEKSLKEKFRDQVLQNWELVLGYEKALLYFNDVLAQRKLFLHLEAEELGISLEE